MTPETWTAMTELTWAHHGPETRLGMPVDAFGT
jgi:hypothetical protein